ncbi:MAG: hypothetical protein WC552_00330 [Candidatus Omnitrophota bacterium]
MNVIEVESNFFGRKGVLDLLKKRLLGLKEGYRQNIALLGDRFVGKTTVLLKFISDLEDDDVIKIYIDLDNRDLHYFSAKFIGSILYHYAKAKNFPLHDDVPLLVETLKEHLPLTVKEIRRIQSHISHGKRNEAYACLLNLPEVFSNETNNFCLVFLEEFHNLEEMSISNAFQELGKKIMTQQKSLYVVTSSYPEIARKILSEKLSLLFGNFEVVTVEPFSLKTSRDFIEQRIKPLKMGHPLRNFLIDFTGGQPLYLNLILKEVVNLASIHQQTEIFNPILIQAIENRIFDQWGVLTRHFELIINNMCSAKGNRIIASALIALSNNKLRLKDLAKILEVKQGVLTQKINRLIDNNLVVKNGSVIYLKDKVFRFWIKYVFQRRLKAITLTPEKLRRDFVEEVENSIDSFNLHSQKDLSNRIMELFQCFDDEAFSINGRKYKLPIFRSVESMKLDAGSFNPFDMIKATSREGDWFIVLKRESFCENDVQRFLVESRKFSPRPQRLIMISFSDLDQNAKLKALQERFWIWNEAEVNALLNFYEKPYIVL